MQRQSERRISQNTRIECPEINVKKKKKIGKLLKKKQRGIHSAIQVGRQFSEYDKNRTHEEKS